MSKTPSRKLQIRNKLKEGKTYTLKIWKQSENGYKEQISKRVRLLKRYQHFALFEHTSGIRECFDYGTIGKMMEEVNE